MNSSNRLILASGSPRRHYLLKEAGFDFTVKTKDTPEVYPPSMPPQEVPAYLSRLKAGALRDEIQNNTVIAADTIVLINNEILGKPENPEHAFRMLQTLSGNMHLVITGVTIYNTSREVSFSDTTEVYFKKLSDKDISAYISRFKPFDKAGAYGAQEWMGLVAIEKIIGSYFNVMGLPVHKVAEALQEFGFYPFD